MTERTDYLIREIKSLMSASSPEGIQERIDEAIQLTQEAIEKSLEDLAAKFDIFYRPELGVTSYSLKENNSRLELSVMEGKVKKRKRGSEPKKGEGGYKIIQQYNTDGSHTLLAEFRIGEDGVEMSFHESDKAPVSLKPGECLKDKRFITYNTEQFAEKVVFGSLSANPTSPKWSMYLDRLSDAHKVLSLSEEDAKKYQEHLKPLVGEGS
jgi:hypothetical protein